MENKKDEEHKGHLSRKPLIVVGILLICLILGGSYAVVVFTVQGNKRQILTAGNLELVLDDSKITANISLENVLPVTDEEGMKQVDYSFSLKNQGQNTVGYTIYIVEDEVEKKTPASAIRYYYKRMEDGKETIRTMSESRSENGKYILESGNIKGQETYNYIYKMWLGSHAGSEVYNTEYSVHLEIKASQLDENAFVSNKAFDSKNVGENCKTYDDGVDTFLVGQCSKNYVWYSGKLWRIVLKNNETGAVKMVTDNAITSISYNPEKQTAFENSYVDQWLTQEFLPTLHDYQDYLVVGSTWDATSNGYYGTPRRPEGTETSQRPVGLLNAYEYYTTYNNSDGLATAETGYLNNDANWWLITATDEYVCCINNMGNNSTPLATNGIIGVRPSINLKLGIKITSGDGSMARPYQLEGDKKETVKGVTSLSSRYSGEYIRFNQELYRVIDIENSLTKITAVDKPKELTSNSFHTEDRVVNFGESSIKTDLENYYQNNIVEPYKSMVAENQIWYLGAVNDGISYKSSICTEDGININVKNCTKVSTTATASIGLPRVGEMFTSQITRGKRDAFLTLTPYKVLLNISVLNKINGLSYASTANSYGARPSMYLKSNVVISKDNTGDGTYESPYDIELAP